MRDFGTCLTFKFVAINVIGPVCFASGSRLAQLGLRQQRSSLFYLAFDSLHTLYISNEYDATNTQFASK